MKQKYFERNFKHLISFLPQFTAMLDEPNLFDDSFRASGPEPFLKHLVMNCEVLVCYELDDEEERSVVGIAIFSDVILLRRAKFIGWVDPKYRTENFEGQKAVRLFLDEDVLPYAWDKLQVVRLESVCAERNGQALAFARNAGFRQVGILTMDFMSQGFLSDTVLLELVNPRFVVAEVEEIDNVRRRRRRDESPSKPDGPVHIDDAIGVPAEHESLHVATDGPEGSSADFPSD